MDSSGTKLTPIQTAVLEHFFQHERGFFLTGGAALAGFYLGHRETSDIDLFTLDSDAFERGRHVLQHVAEELGGSLEIRQDAPGFKRFAITRRDDALVVDLVLERVTQLYPEKRQIGTIVVDPPEEILANKLTTVVSRAEERDLVDLYCLERAGYRIEDALEAALAKDGGCTPATLAWLLSQVELPDEAKLPGKVSVPELRAFVADLVDRLRKRAFPRT